MRLAQYIEHTLLHPTATTDQIKKLCKEAKTHQFYGVCVNGCHVTLAKQELKGTSIKIVSVIGFPLGAMSSEAKRMEANHYLDLGADEIDMVLNIGWLKSGNEEAVREEIGLIKQSMGPKVLKVILETCFLSDNEIQTACRLVSEAGADFVKTSTGFGTSGATIEHVRLMKEAIDPKLRIKASGGIKDFETAQRYIALGVSRIGTSSGVEILAGNNKEV